METITTVDTRAAAEAQFDGTSTQSFKSLSSPPSFLRLISRTIASLSNSPIHMLLIFQPLVFLLFVKKISLRASYSMDVSQQNQKLCSVSIIHFSVEPNNRIDGASTSQRLKKLKHLRNRHVNYGNAFF